MMTNLTWLNPQYQLYPETEGIYLTQMEVQSQRKLILFFHGFGDYPANYQNFAQQLHAAGYDIVIPRLSGHGSSAADFASSTARDWLRSALEPYLDLCSQRKYQTDTPYYDEIILGGLSMGGLIASILAERIQPKRLLLLTPAFFLRAKTIYFTPILQWFTKHLAGDWDEEKELNKPQHLNLRREYWRYHYLKPLAQFLKIQRNAQKQIAKLGAIIQDGSAKTEVFLLLAGSDKRVNSKKVESLLRRALAQHVQISNLAKVHHLCVEQASVDLVAQTCIDWLKETENLIK